ncbi:hypothetical protein N7491_003965 [Penicillium cf. griseofulvum]|uniref:Uncharacterized protein n=1 Tax=Penicillium cf. griseofulvum TaxID=2972120 RepID=A0A9W9MQ66_9EURO|nr:hypothetical protein N7472_001858 [Penicillium cf. griseofulvum]KAJ5441559.1 hypothetical protein N7491_003965 [Penicillium cf. griseofulvum]
MGPEGLYKCACRRVPEAYCLIIGTGRQETAVGREGYRPNLTRMASEGLRERARC